MKNRLGLLLLSILCLAYLQLPAQSQLPTSARPVAGSHDATQISGPSGQAPKPSRLIVKLRPEFAGGVEAALPDDMVLKSGTATSEEIRQFMGRYSARSMAPLYSDIVRVKKQQRISGREFALAIRDRFRARARRLETAFNPPDISRTYLLQLSTVPQELPRVLARLKTDPRVEFAEIDDVASITYTPDDPYFSTSGSWGQWFDDLWGIKRVNAPTAWDVTAGQGVTVAVVDTGLDTTHPDIAANVWTNTREIKSNGIDDDGNGFIDDANGWNFVSSNNYVKDDHGHGTHVSGTIAGVGNNGIGVIGVAWRAKIMPVKALDAGGYGYDSGLASALIYAANNGADVINNSWRGWGTSQAISDAVSYAHNMGAVVIAAAGNEATDASCCFPANRPEAVTVAASTPYDNLAYFSNRGEKIDVAAPGEDVLSLRAAGTSMGMTVDTQYTVASGTSMAAPHASGVAALIVAQHPEYSNEQVRQVMRMSASGNAGYDLMFGYGILNSSAAVAISNALEVKFTDPPNGTEIQSTITLHGIARGVGFSSYTLEYGSGDLPATWTTFYTSTAPTSDVLGTFDPGPLADGIYVIRLTAYNGSGAAFVDRVRVVIRTTKITEPLPPHSPPSSNMYKPGAVVSIKGIANGANFESFEVEWARGLNVNDGWQTTGLSLTGAGTKPVEGGTLATWNTSGIADADYYTIRLILHRGEITNEARTIVYLQPDLVSTKFPIILDPGPNQSSGIVPARNSDGSTRLILAASVGQSDPAALWTISPDGQSVEKIPMPQYVSGSSFQPSVADLDDMAGDEVIFADYNVIRAFRRDGTSWTFAQPQETVFDFSRARLVVEDVDGDSKFETIGLVSNLVGTTAGLYVWKPDGSLLTGFPVSIQDNNDIRGWLNRSRLLVADLDGDGAKEIVVSEGLTASTFQLRAFASDGTAKEWPSPVIEGMPWALAAADLDHEGKIEVVQVSRVGNRADVHVLQADGSERAGWPVSLMDAYSDSFVAIADLDRDGFEQIVLALGTQTYVFNSNGTVRPGWPYSAYNYAVSSGVVAGDVDGDGYPEIVNVRNEVGYTSDPFFPYSSFYDQSLVVLKRDGTLSRRWQLTGRDGFDLYVGPLATIGDFNRDGITEIAVNQVIIGPDDPRGVVTVFNTGAPYRSSGMDWPLYLQNPRNTGVLNTANEKAASLVVLNSSANPALVGQSITLKAKVTKLEDASVISAGSVEFYDESWLIGAVALDENGEATITTSDLGQGTHTLSVKFLGNTTSYGSYSAPVTETISYPDFQLAGGSTSTVRAGQSAAFTITVSGNPGPYSSPVDTFTCTGLPRGTACHFNPTSVTPGDTNAAVDLSISTTARTTAALAPVNRSTTLLALTLSGSFIAFGAFVMPSFRRFRAPVLLVIAFAAMLVSCGGGGGSNPPPPPDHGTPAGTYTITVSAIGEGVSHTTTVMMTVQ